MRSATRSLKLYGVLIAAIVLLPNGNAFAKQPASDKGPIKIGFITCLTGVAADNGTQARDAIEAYVDEIHHQIAGRKVELIVENDGSNPATAIQKAKKLIEQDHVQVLDGLMLTNIGNAVAPIAEHDQVPLVVSTSAADDLTQRKQYNWLVRSGFNSSGSTYPFGEWAYKKLGFKRVVTLGVDFQYGYEVVAGFQRTFELAGGQVVQKLWVPFGFTDFAPYIKQIRKDADALFICTAGKAAELLPKQLADNGVKLPVVAGGTSFDESVLTHMGDEAIGAVSVLGYTSALNTPANKHFVQIYKAKSGGVEPGYYAESAWTSGMVIKKAAEAVNGDVENKEKFMAALKKVELTDTPGGPLRFDDRGSVIRNFYVRKVAKVNGKLQNTVAHTFPMVSEFWKFDPTEYLQQPPYSKDYPPAGTYHPQAK